MRKLRDDLAKLEADINKVKSSAIITLVIPLIPLNLVFSKKVESLFYLEVQPGCQPPPPTRVVLCPCMHLSGL